jgi:3'-phosphoadenosine 5'-phosphosulfate sulfotransferase (PAPS reductase)/FAD synthetase
MDPFLVDQPTVISFSGGRTSAYMLWRVLQSNNGLPKEAIVCFANTGKEEEATLRFVDRCSKEWNVPITWLEYADAPEVKDRFKQVTFETASREGEPFEALILKRKYLPNPVSRFCTVELKVRTIHRYLKANGWTEWDSMIGIRADEQRRLAKIGNQDYGKHEEKVAPLGRVGITKELVGEFWRSQPFDLELPNMNGVTKHGNCDLCYLKPAGQVLSLIQEKPSRAIWWAKMEQVIQSTGQLTGDGARFRSDRPSYSQMASFTDQQTDMFDTNEEGIACFCGD